MADYLVPVEKTCNTIISSRITQEQFDVENSTTGYGKLAALINSNIDSIDALIEFVAAQIADQRVKNQYDKQYFNPKFGDFKNFMTRNIYLDPMKKKEMEKNRELLGYITNLGTEVVLKSAIRASQSFLINKDKFQTLSQIYGFIASYSNENSENADMRRAKIELSKIRNQLPLSIREKEKLLKIVPKQLEDIPGITAFQNEDSGKLKEDISYLLYSIYCQKYGEYLINHENDHRYEDTLLLYYNYLGYNGKVAQELLKDNAETYNNISGHQTNYLKLSRRFVNQVFVKIPEIDIDRIHKQATEMAQYDPYSFRRRKVQTAGAATIVTIAAIIAEQPMIAIQAGSTALSQLQLENNDNMVEFLEKTLKQSGVDSTIFNTMLNQSKNIRSTSNGVV